MVETGTYRRIWEARRQDLIDGNKEHTANLRIDVEVKRKIREWPQVFSQFRDVVIPILERTRDNDPEIAELPREKTRVLFFPPKNKDNPTQLGFFGLFWGKISLTPEEQELINRFNQIRETYTIRPTLNEEERTKLKEECRDLSQTKVNLLDCDSLVLGVFVDKPKDGTVDYRLSVSSMIPDPMQAYTLEEIISGLMDRQISEGLKNPEHLSITASVPSAANFLRNDSVLKALSQIPIPPTR